MKIKIIAIVMILFYTNVLFSEVLILSNTSFITNINMFAFTRQEAEKIALALELQRSYRQILKENIKKISRLKMDLGREKDLNKLYALLGFVGGVLTTILVKEVISR